MSPSDLGERSIITGDPENCRRILKDCEDAGIQEVILYFNFGGLGHSDTIEAMEPPRAPTPTFQGHEMRLLLQPCQASADPP